MLNLACAEGLRSVKLSDVQRVRLLNPVLDSELKRALEVLAMSHDMQKKAVSLLFAGEGKRPVRVGYVVENPIWKTSYRLVLDRNGKPFLQGWAVVENSSDDDWNNVRMSLVSGRPISFQMDLYQPLYIPRPMVEPELFASLRPPTYSGAISGEQAIPLPAGVNLGFNPAFMNPAFIGNRYQRGNQLGMQGGLNGAWGLNQMGFQGGGIGGFAGGFNGVNLGQLGGQGGVNPLGNNANFNMDQTNYRNRLTFEEYEKRRNEQKALNVENAKQQAQAILNPRQGVASVASAEEIGDFFQYTIDQPVSLPRQKSALLPIINKDVEGTKVSIYNESVQSKFPLLGLKLKNTSGQHLMQGPVTVFEGGAYAGDARVLDLQPGEERLLSYAIDLGTEVKPDSKSSPDQLVAVKVVKGVIHTSHKLRETKTYQIKNRTEHDRTLIIEHPIRTDWKLVTPEKPAERSREVYRFQLAVAAGKSATQQVVEEQTLVNQAALSNSSDQAIRILLRSTVTSPKVKAALEKAVEMRTRLAGTQNEIVAVEKRLKAIADEQIRLRANLERLPKESAAYKRAVDKFDTQETEIEQLQEQLKKLQETTKERQQEYDDFLTALTVE
jgi:hypothetical protein